MSSLHSQPPATVGMSLSEVDTPALLVDLDALEANIKTMQQDVSAVMERRQNVERGVHSKLNSTFQIRPHAKAHKCPSIALRQVSAGAVGVCCQKTSEAIDMVNHGVKNVFVSNEVVGEIKIDRLAELAKRAEISVCADNLENIAQLSRAAQTRDVTLTVLVEMNVGGDRCGVEPGEQVLNLTRAIQESKHLRFGGIHAYHGAAQHIRYRKDREIAIATVVEKVKLTLDLLAQHNIEVPVVTGAGTGTYEFESASSVFNEIQPGSYIFMDADYGLNFDESDCRVHRYRNSLYILATVMSHPVPLRAVVDVGLKAHSIDSGMPLVLGVFGAKYTKASDEHGVIELEHDNISLGQKIKLIPGHCDPTVNLYDWIVAYRGDKVEELWPVSARGAFY